MPRKKEEKKGIFNFLNKNVKDFNKIVLSLGCISFLLLMGFISYKINNSYAYFTNDVKGSKLIEMTYTKPSLDESGANAPELTNAMIPVYYDETNNVWKKADKSNSKEKYKWYDYDKKMWANAVTVTDTNRNTYLSANAGTEINMNDINTMWVWIPRYTYTYLNTNTPQEINIKFEKGTTSSGTISCSDAINQTTGESHNSITISEICTDTTNNGLVAGTSTYTHPAFWWDKNDDSIRDKDEELTGIWVGKFEVSSDTTCAAGTSSNIGERCNLTTIRPKIIPNVTSWTGAMLGTFFNGIYNMRESGNQYGFSTTDETHMIKNMEWGAVAYLSHSKYGRCTDGKCEKIGINNCSKYITGIGDYATSSESDTTCTNSENQYNNTRGMFASTTGNVYGIYDMSGGTQDFVMGNVVNSDGKPLSGGGNDSEHLNSGFTGYLRSGGSFTGTYEFPSKRYYDQYSYVKYSDASTKYERGKLGDATKEMNPSFGVDAWYGNYSVFPEVWFHRGGSSTGEERAGIFAFGDQYGPLQTGGASSHISSRAVISNLK